MSVRFLGLLGPSLIELPFFLAKVPAGFPSPAADYLESRISLDELFDTRAPHIYLVKIDGDSMNGAGLYSGDLVTVDRISEAKHGDIVIAALNGEPICKRLHCKGKEVILQPENSAFPKRFILETDDMVVWGAVRYMIRDHAYA